MKTIGDRIRARRKQLGWTQAKLAGMLNIKMGTLSGYERNYRLPDARMLQLMASVMNISSDYLLDVPQSEPKPIKRLLPIIGTIRSAASILADENINGYLEVPDDIQADYVLTVKDDSMIGAGILAGDYAICRETEVAESGQIVSALKEMQNGLWDLRLEYYFDDKGDVLKPANPHYPETDLNQGWKITGVMVALIRKESPGYKVYKDYLGIFESEDWTEIVNLSSQAGLKAQQVKEIVLGQIEIAKRLKA